MGQRTAASRAGCGQTCPSIRLRRRSDCCAESWMGRSEWQDFEPATPSSQTRERGVRVDAKSLFRFKASVSTRTLRKYLIRPNMGHLPGPPRSPAQTEISQFNANRPELAAICARILSLQSADWIAGTVLRSLSLPW